MRRAAALAVAALACGGGSGTGRARGGRRGLVEAPYDQPFELGLGQGALVAGEFHVTFERLAEESRCPEAQSACRRGTRPRHSRSRATPGIATLTLNTGRKPERAAAMGGELRLVELAPRPGADASPTRRRTWLR